MRVIGIVEFSALFLWHIDKASGKRNEVSVTTVSQIRMATSLENIIRIMSMGRQHVFCFVFVSVNLKND